MVFDKEGVLDEDIQDTLYELGNVGVGMATGALGNIMGIRVKINTPEVFLIESDLFDKFMQSGKENQIGILMKFTDTLSGVVLLLMDDTFLTDIVKEFTGEVHLGKDIIEDEESLSAVHEFANITSAAYMKAIGSYTGIRIYLSPVSVAELDTKSLLEKAMDNLKEQYSKVICVDTGFSIIRQDGRKNTCEGRIIMLPTEESVEKMMQGLGL